MNRLAIFLFPGVIMGNIVLPQAAQSKITSTTIPATSTHTWGGPCAGTIPTNEPADSSDACIMMGQCPTSWRTFTQTTSITRPTTGTPALNPASSTSVGTGNNKMNGKHDVSQGAQLIAAKTRASHLKANRVVHQPAGAALFTIGQLQSQWDNLVTTLTHLQASTIIIKPHEPYDPQSTKPRLIKTADYPQFTISAFIPLWRKIQFLVLNDLYIYLLSLYSTFNMTHTDTIPEYLTAEETHALNKKSMIISHLLNVIQGQMLYVCSSQTPTMAKQTAIKLGGIAIQNDKTMDPLVLLQDLSLPFFEGDNPADHTYFSQAQNDYLAAISLTMNFFNNFTALITQDDTTSKIPFTNAFTAQAQKILSVIQNDPFTTFVQQNITNMPIAATSSGSVAGLKTALSAAQKKNPTSQEVTQLSAQLKSAIVGQQTGLKSRLTALRNAQNSIPIVNPPLLYFNKDTIRALKMIPCIAKELSSTVTSTGYPEHLIALVTTQKANNVVKNSAQQSLSYPIAFLEEGTFPYSRKNITYNPNAQPRQRLFINLTTDQGPFSQQIMWQPEWMNSYSGIVNMLRACLGDWTQLIGPNKLDDVLDSCMEAILCKATNQTPTHVCTASADLSAAPTGCALEGNCCSQMLQKIACVQNNYMSNPANKQAIAQLQTQTALRTHAEKQTLQANSTGKVT